MKMKKKILVTGAAGFIGAHLSEALCKKGYDVVGIDNLNNYYDPSLKEARINNCSQFPNFQFFQMDITDRESLKMLFCAEPFKAVFHLAGQAGVRYSIANPTTYIDTNIVGFYNIIDSARRYKIPDFIYASSSSVYGNNTHIPFSEEDKTDMPLNLYAATKKADELIAYTYSHLYGIHTTGLRFFTVYGPWGRPDMAPLKFMKAIIEGKPIHIFNNGNLYRDFTYIDDIVKGIMTVFRHPSDELNPYRIYNIGHSKPILLNDFISEIEMITGHNAIKQMEGMQPGDMFKTFADNSAMKQDFGFEPTTDLHDGLLHLYYWFVRFYKRGDCLLRVKEDASRG
jgi:UDP-glucuronate 4-epimerase